MRLTLTGHAGLFIESAGQSILCDPWFEPAYFASWFPFPDNDSIDWARFAHPTYLYISHLHHDHFDAGFLARHVAKDVEVLLPDLPTSHLRRALERVGFHHFIETSNGKPIGLEGLRIMICTAGTPADGPLGDSTLSVDDGEVCVLDQNDCRPRDVDALLAFGSYDAHFLQYSGAIWYPMTYRFDDATMETLGRQKRQAQMARSLRYAQAIGAANVVPFAGPPAFLDDELFHLNDTDDDPANIFVDQRAFLRYLAEHGMEQGRLMVAGSEASLQPGLFEVRHAVSEEELTALFEDKLSYLSAYRERRRSQFAAITAGWTDDGPDVIAALAEWWEPLLAVADRVCARMGPIVLDLGADVVLIDPVARSVRRWSGEGWEHRFTIDRRLVRSLVARRVDDWVNELFLSFRFTVERTGPYNDAVFTFFKCLSADRIAYAEAALAPTAAAPDLAADLTHPLSRDQRAPFEVWRCGQRLVQRWCPHLGADLCRFADVDGDLLTCTVHGWRFDLGTGRCLTADGDPLLTAHLASDID
jgi:UDP-MurNAc hydroxylase